MQHVSASSSHAPDVARPSGTLLLSGRDVASLLDIGDCIDAVERAWVSHAEGRSIPPGVLGAHVEGGGFHLKTAGLTDASYFAAKLNGNFFHNDRLGLPRIQGLVVLCDTHNGYPLAVMDSIEITAIRTAAATAVAANHLAVPEASCLTICGCGRQGEMHVHAIQHVRPLERVLAYDAQPGRAQSFADSISRETGLDVEVVDQLRSATLRSEVTVTCTPSREPLLGPADVLEGAFVGAVGADSEEKQELDPALLAASLLVVDDRGQCAAIGELHHALDGGLLPSTNPPAEIHEVITGARAGRTSPTDIVVYDSTGVALQDVAAAALVYERALEQNMGRRIDLSGTT